MINLKIASVLICISVAYVLPLMAKSIEQPLILKIPKPRAAFDISHDYHLSLLKMALVEAAKGRAIPQFEILPTGMSQGRAIIELMKGDLLDVYWLGSDQETDEKLRAIKIPTTRGLIGYRKFLINSAAKTAFDQVQSIDDLKNFVACQGAHWPDTKILAQAKLPVVSSTNYEHLFAMLDAKRCDYFPRAYHDIENELHNISDLYPNIIQYERILLHYPFAVYFYTNQSNEFLARWIEDGLKALASKAAIEALMVKHPFTAHIFPLKNEQHSLYLTLDNSLLAPNTNILNRQFWFTREDFNTEVTTKQ